jgi:hypothetical protein
MVIGTSKYSEAAKKAWRSRKRKGKKWIQKAIKKKGALSRQLDIPEEQNIPISLLGKIKKAKIGSVVKNPTGVGKKRIKVTRLVKQRATLAHTLKTKID